ncbi:hypothetical protein M408DRAFT_333984 [Serendipita vermifera MAFF 305830]|uniref:Uncharacterized protein n=1 Tax=Serendipita vermifera MAFF 305830 TaxID=933852 RepID=A0A0C3AM97_SERVB|nr:hypothetical protein M408DRAFT_333984 [Serendipita vermifera MAFF 305830]
MAYTNLTFRCAENNHRNRSDVHSKTVHDPKLSQAGTSCSQTSTVLVRLWERLQAYLNTSICSELSLMLKSYLPCVVLQNPGPGVLGPTLFLS